MAVVIIQDRLVNFQFRNGTEFSLLEYVEPMKVQIQEHDKFSAITASFH